MGAKKRDITSTWEHKSLVLINLGEIQQIQLLLVGKKLICNHGYLQYITFFCQIYLSQTNKKNFPVSLQNISSNIKD